MYLFAVIVLICSHVTTAEECPTEMALKKELDQLIQDVLALKQASQNVTVSPSQKGASFTVSHPPDATTITLKQPIKFAKIIDNCGNGYDKETGKFTAHTPGQYVFSMSFQEHRGWANCDLMKNSNVIGQVQPRDDSVTDTASFTSVLNLNKGDTVWVRYNGGTFYIAEYAYFTGGLIHGSSTC